MTVRARVVVMGATAGDAPPGIGTIEDVVELAFAEDSSALPDALEGADVLFAWRPRGELLASAWGRAGALRWIQSASAGVDDLLFPELARSHVVLTNARGVYEDAIAEYVLGWILALSKDLAGVLERQRRREWGHRETERLEGKRVLVVGVGPVGRAIARVCSAMGMAVRGVGRSGRTGNEPPLVVVGVDRLASDVGWADVVVNALPETPETHHLFDGAIFGAMNPWTRFVNVGRGGTVDEGAMVDALASGAIAGAVLDVFEREPLPATSPLWTMPNVVVSPHMAGDAAGWREAVVELFVRNLQRYLTGKPLLNVVDKERGYVPS